MLDSIPKLRQLNFKPTYKDKCIDVILSNMAENYGTDEVYKAIDPDDTAKAKPSDHDPAIVHPLDDVDDKTREYKEIRFRPLPNSGIQLFANLVIEEEWEQVKSSDDPTDQVLVLNSLLKEKLESAFPMKTLKISTHINLILRRKSKTLTERKRESIANMENNKIS